MSKLEYYAEGLGESFEQHGVTATQEQITNIAADVLVCVEHEGMAFYTPPASERLEQIEGEWRKKYEALQREFDTYRGNAETAVKQALRQYSDASVSIGEHGEVLRHGGRTERIQ